MPNLNSPNLTDPSFGVRVELETIITLKGRTVERHAVLWHRPDNKIITNIKITQWPEFGIDKIVYKDLATTLLVEPTAREIKFRENTGVLSPFSERYILFNCTNVEGCNYKQVIKVVFNEHFGDWVITDCGDLEDGCPKCKKVLYSCGKPVTGKPSGALYGFKTCMCISKFKSVGLNIAVPNLDK